MRRSLLSLLGTRSHLHGLRQRAVFSSAGPASVGAAQRANLPSQLAKGGLRSCLIEGTTKYLGHSVTLSGWIAHSRVMGPDRIFIVLRDHTANVQLLLQSDRTAQFDTLRECISERRGLAESVITVRGLVVERPPGQARRNLTNGTIEVVVDSMDILNEATNLPFNPVAEHTLPEEDLRLTYRFIDLRRAQLQKNLRTRAKINQTLRIFMEARGFLEVETPMLFKSTPEGAREFLVPTERIRPGSNFALAQSPQQFKQMLMVGAIDKYYQIARCFRDEDLRADRQPEFTQLDMEMSWVTMNDVMETMEELIRTLWSSILNLALPATFPRLTYAEALSRYGSDKPDTRYSFLIRELSRDGKIVREELDLSSVASRLALPSLLATYGGALILSPDGQSVQGERSIDEHVGSSELGKLRSTVIRDIEARGWAADYRQGSTYNFLWVYDFPLLARAQAANNPLTGAPARRYESMHHPFTAPHPDDLPLLLSGGDPLEARGQHYDLVLNGTEVGGGSIRIHSPHLQGYILREVIGLAEDYVTQFEHLLVALASGCPPHGGMALGLDRLVALMCGTDSIRDVIAFPKNGSGFDLCVRAPN